MVLNWFSGHGVWHSPVAGRADYFSATNLDIFQFLMDCFIERVKDDSSPEEI
jgi:hypothetical protein